MRDIFGKTGIIGGLELGIAAAFVLGSLIFRKAVANDMLDRGFSIIGSCVLGILTFLITSNIFSSIKLSVGLGLFAWVVGGFLLAEIIQDGWADGGGD